MVEGFELLESWQTDGRKVMVKLLDGESSSGVIDALDERGMMFLDGDARRCCFIPYSSVAYVAEEG